MNSLKRKTQPTEGGNMSRMIARMLVAAAMTLAVLGVTTPAEAAQSAPKCKVSITQAALPHGYVKVTTTTKCRNVTTVTFAYVRPMHAGWL